MTEVEFLDQKLGEIADQTLEENSAKIVAIKSEAALAGAMGGSRQVLSMGKSYKTYFRQGVLEMSEFALRHCAGNEQPKEIAKDALEKAANNLQAKFLVDFNGRFAASAAFDGARGPTTQQEIVTKLVSELEDVLNSALLDMERGYAGNRQIRDARANSPTLGPVAPSRELEQKFQILFSVPQEGKDFDKWRADAEDQGFQIGILFIDIDDFKTLNTRYTETKIDKTILLEVQILLRQLTAHRGAAYRHGGEEFVVQLPNHNSEEVMAFAEEVRKAFETHEFLVDGIGEALTVSIGAAIYPDHGEALDELLTAANTSEKAAKNEGKNTIRMAT